MRAYVSANFSSLIKDTDSSCNYSKQSFGVLDIWLTLKFWLVEGPFKFSRFDDCWLSLFPKFFPYLRLLLGLNCLILFWVASLLFCVCELLSSLDDQFCWPEVLFCCWTLLVVKAARVLLNCLAGLCSVVWWKPLHTWQRFEEGQVSLRCWLLKQFVHKLFFWIVWNRPSGNN